MIDTLHLYNELKESMDSIAAEKIARTMGLIYDELRTAVTKTEFNDLHSTVERMAESQDQTKVHMSGLEAALERLAEAQTKTEVALKRLAEAQAKTELSVDRMEKQLDDLSEIIGGTIEEIAYIVLHKVLKREFGWQVSELKRVWQKWGKHPEEVDVIGKAVDPTRPKDTIWIVGEAEFTLTKRGVKRFIKQVERAKLYLGGEIFPVCFCYHARPEIQEMIAKANIRLVFSYGELI